MHIAFQEQISHRNDVELLFFKNYFDKISTGKRKGFRAETTIPFGENDYLIADAIYMLQTFHRKELYAIEIFNGLNVQRVCQSLEQHVLALKDGQPSSLFGIDYGSRILCIFELESCKINVMKKLEEDKRFADAKAYFLFKSLEEVKQNVVENWELFDGEKTELY